jgi:ATP-dependent Lon protease
MTKTTILEIKHLIKDKIERIQRIIQNTISALNLSIVVEIITNSELMLCTNSLVECFEKSVQLVNAVDTTSDETTEQVSRYIEELQSVIDKLSVVLCGYGTLSIDDILFVSFGADYGTGIPLPKSVEESEHMKKVMAKRELILQHIRPIGYKTIHWKNTKTGGTNSSLFGSPLCVNKITEETLAIELAAPYECFDIDLNSKPIYTKIYGVRVVIHCAHTQKTLIIQGIVDDIVLDCVQNAYVNERKRTILGGCPSSETFDAKLMERIRDTLSLKDILVFGDGDIYKKHIAIFSDVNFIRYNKLNAVIKKFLDMDLYSQRQMLMNLLIYNQEDEIQYITYLLYDLITTKSTGTSSIDSFDQQIIYDSFPWRVKQYFKDTMKNTLKFTKDMTTKYDISRISLEQQIYVMKVPEQVREKAMVKLKEIKGKGDDTGAKAKQYLEGLLKIPFGVYREEEILKKVRSINSEYIALLTKSSVNNSWLSISSPLKQKYTVLEMMHSVRHIRSMIDTQVRASLVSDAAWNTGKQVNTGYQKMLELTSKSKKLHGTKEAKIQALREFSESCSSADVVAMYDAIGNSCSMMTLCRTTQEIETAICALNGGLDTVTQVLDESIYGHEHAKNQILKIIGQWMSGEQTGYCFGFEGSPGIGKTSLAKKGLAHCLKDEHGVSRPFAFIALGGSCNGSTLEGHSYTYVNSTWGRIVDVLMDSKCMNPIIYIDELDKVSKTEHGKEIIGILMHLIDTTQNTGFQDKYFSGIDIDLSKVLFIFSYNDPAQIDSILLDRIHRIRFDNLSLDDKVVIVRKYILPEINRKMGMDGCVEMSDEIIEFMIEHYTMESGVRKLKEVMFDLFGEINIAMLRSGGSVNTNAMDLPIVLTEQLLVKRYLSKYTPVKEKKIHERAECGVINGLWANALGHGGIIPIQVSFFPTTTFLELKLTGQQGDVMKESMNVAKSLAWSLLTTEEKEAFIKMCETTKTQGLHIHCPEGAVPKDGPSAGAAITLSIYSLLAKRAIHNNVAITGETNLQGQITEIGGLQHKILGGIRAGIKTFLYPVSNQLDFDKFMEKYGDKSYIQSTQFVPVDKIEQTFEHIFVSL